MKLLNHSYSFTFPVQNGGWCRRVLGGGVSSGEINVLNVIFSTFTMSASDENSVLSQILKKLASIESVLNDHTEKLHHIQTAVDDHGTRIESLETSLEFHGRLVQDQQNEIKTLKTELATQQKDFLLLKQDMDNHRNELKQEKLDRNRQDQYFRSSFFVQLHGIVIQPGEEKADNKEASNKHTLGIVKKLALNCNFEGFDESQVDVCHRVSKNVFSPIIIKFKFKSDRMRFYKQRHLLKDKKSSDFGFQPTKNQVAMFKSSFSSRDLPPNGRGHASRSSQRRTEDVQLPFASISEHLTKFNADLLKKARFAAKDLKYEFPGYTINGEVRVKPTSDSQFIPIHSMGDISKIR